MDFTNNDLFENYDQLLPPKFEGGFLVLTLYHKIKAKEIESHFTSTDIKQTLEEIALKYEQPLSQSERITKNLLNFLLRNVPNDPGKYYLTDHAVSLVELLVRKLQNPYKNFPLKQNFEKYFTIRNGDIQSISDLERKFGREFVSGHKRIINDHLEAFEDDLMDAYSKLNSILQSDEISATRLIKNFTIVFKTFGERAEDISNAIITKDKFLRTLRQHVDLFYQKVENYKHPENIEEKNSIESLKLAWLKASEIYKDLDSFFETVEYKIGNIRRLIINASGKLSELHEEFSSRSQFRIRIRKLFIIMLENASYNENGLCIHHSFPRKTLVQEKTQLFFPTYYEFGLIKQNSVIFLPEDKEYELTQKAVIEQENKRQEIIATWIEATKDQLKNNQEIKINTLLNQILSQEKDVSVAYEVALEITRFASEEDNYALIIKKNLIATKNNEIFLWNMELSKKLTITS